MAKILVVDDEEKICEVIKEYAEYEGHQVIEAGDGIQAIDLFNNYDFDIVILDIMMPRLDGFSTCKELKKIRDVPVIMLSARGEEYDKLFGFELGIDDYVVKPFSPKVLMARVKAVLHRFCSKNINKMDHDIYDFDGLHIDITARNVFVNGKKVDMTPKEYELLFFLVRNKNIAFSREKLLSEVWGYDFFGDDRTIDTHIKMLRSSICEYRKFLVTVRGVGYKFEY